MYSASVDDRATVDCFLHDNEIEFESMWMIYALVDLRSKLSPPQSASQNSLKTRFKACINEKLSDFAYSVIVC